MTRKTSPQPGDGRAEGLTGPARQLHQAVLTAFTRTGKPPARVELEQIARSLGATPDAALAGHAGTRVRRRFSPDRRATPAVRQQTAPAGTSTSSPAAGPHGPRRTATPRSPAGYSPGTARSASASPSSAACCTPQPSAPAATTRSE